MDVLHQYFLVPIMRNGWFNPVNSIAYGLLLIIGILAVFRLLKRMGIKIDNRLIISLTPFIAFAGVTRTLRDYVYLSSTGEKAFFQSFTAHMQAMQQNAYGLTSNHALASIDSYIIAWFPTPGSYLITFMLALFSLFVSVLAQKYLKIAYWKAMFSMGFIFLVINSALLKVNSFAPLLYIGAVSAAWSMLFFGLNFTSQSKFLKKRKNTRIISGPMKKIFTRINCAVLSAHLFDATATFFAISMFSTLTGEGYTEQHFLSRGLMPFLGPQVMFLLKLAVVLPVLYLIDRYVEEKDFNSFLKIVIFILGMAPAARNITRLMVGV